MKRILFIYTLFPVLIFSQSDTSSTAENLIIDLLEEASVDIDSDYLLDILEDLENDPININYAGINELMRIPFLDFGSAKKIIDHRSEFGKYFSTGELYTVGIGDELAAALQRFTTHRERTDEKLFGLDNYSIELRSRLINDLQEKKGFKEGNYIGNPFKSYQRAKISFGKIRFSGLVEKDPGENNYNDFSSFSFSIENYKFITNLTAGDYLIKFGEGLALWGPYSFGKGSEAVRSISKSAAHINGYSSTDENRFFRGSALSVNFNPVTISFFYSDNDIDANIDTVTNSIRSRPAAGYHRTASEVSKSDLVNEKSFGSLIHISPAGKLDLGFSFHRTMFSLPLGENDFYDPAGDAFNFYSFSYSYPTGYFRISGEFAYNSISVASLNNFEWIISERIQFITSVRNYPRNYFSLHGTGFGESSNTQNEFGIYNGVRWRSDFGILNFYYDQFRFPFSSFNSPLPSKGDEFLIDFVTRPFVKTKFGLRFKRENKEITETVNNSKSIFDQTKTNYRISLEFYPAVKLRLKSRLEYVTFHQPGLNINEEGFLIFQDFRYDHSGKLRLYGRLIIFRSDSYDSRIYEFENDLRGVMLNPPLYGEGIRWYFIVEYNPFNFLHISGKYSETTKPDESFLGSGLNEIHGSLDNRISLQIDINF